MEVHSKRHPVPSDVAAGIIVYLGGLFVLDFFIPGGFAASNAKSPTAFVIAQIADAFLLVSIPLFFIYRVYSYPPRYFGLSAPGAIRDLLIGFAAGIALAIVAFAYGEVVKWFGYFQRDPYIESFSNSPSPAMSAAVIFAVVALLPVAEEIFFRGFIFCVIRTHTSTSAAATISAALFGLAHLNAAAFAFYVLFGVVLALLLNRSASLLPAIAAHVTFNAIALAISATTEPSAEQLSGERVGIVKPALILRQVDVQYRTRNGGQRCCRAVNSVP
jgi:membrane protease YdiL (CAAX protease family)